MHDLGSVASWGSVKSTQGRRCTSFLALAWELERSSQLKSIYGTRETYLTCIHNTVLLLVVAVQSLGRVRLFMTPWTAARQAFLSPCPTMSQGLLKLMSFESVIPSNHLILCQPLLLLPSIFPSIKVFSNESVLRITWPKCWNFSFSISPSNEYWRSISFRIDWFDLLAVPGTLKSLLQHHSSKASILHCSALFMVCRYLYKIFRLIRKYIYYWYLNIFCSLLGWTYVSYWCSNVMQ